MKYELQNRYYGIKIIAPSEKAKDHILSSSKKDPKDNLPVWEVTKELPDEPSMSNEQKLLQEIEDLKRQLSEAGQEPVATATPEAKSVQRTAPPKKKAKKLGDKGSSI